MTPTELKRAGREYHIAGRFEAAESFYRQAIELDKTAVDARLNLGMVLCDLGRNAEAAEVLRKLAGEYPTLPAAWAQLARALVPLGFREEARQAITRSLTGNPDVISILAASKTLMALGDPAASESVAERAIKTSPDNVPAWLQFGQIIHFNGRTQEAAAAYRRALALEPGNALAAFLLAANSVAAGGSDATAAPPVAPPPPEFVRALFDSSAERFDAHLVGSLKYQAPRILERMFQRHLESRGAEARKSMVMLDAGCGTGLCGLWLARYRGRLTGVDLSRPMIAKAQARAIYDELIAGEITEELEKRTGMLDIVVAADVLIYFGDLSRLFAAAAAALRPGGVFLFSVEASTDVDFKMLPSERFGHSSAYLHRLCVSNGLAVRAVEEAVIRLERGEKVPGYLMLAERRI